MAREESDVNNDQFDALVALTRLHARSAAAQEGARLVLVEGLASAEAAARVGVTRQALSNVLTRCRRTLELVQKVTKKEVAIHD